jgi:hypothetical protein
MIDPNDYPKTVASVNKFLREQADAQKAAEDEALRRHPLVEAAFAAFPQAEIVATLSRQLSWSHFLVLLPLKNRQAKQYYVNLSTSELWSVRELRHQIERKAFERNVIANVQLSQEQTYLLNTFKDPYLLDFLNLKNTYLENDLENYATKYQCTSPQICAHMCMSEELSGGPIIFSGNFARDFNYTYTILGLKRYADTSGRSVIPFFLLHDPELAGVLPQAPGNGNNYSTKKYEAYSKLGVPVIPQPGKQTGFEVIKDYYDTRKDLVVPPKIRIKYANMLSKRKFDLLFRYMIMEKIKYVDQIAYIRPKQQ